jgi:hypothetical protein
VDHRLEISSEGMLTRPDVHDARLVGLVMLERGDLAMLLRLTDDCNVGIVLIGVERLRANDFRQGNIVLDITVSTGADVGASDIAFAYGLEQDNSQESLAFLETTLAKFHAKTRILVELNSSYGCSLICICEKIDVTADWPDYTPTFSGNK